MKFRLYLLVCIFIFSGPLSSQFVNADDSTTEEQTTQTETDSTETNSESETVAEAVKTKWHDSIQTKYSYTDKQMKTLTDSGLNHAQLAKVAHIAHKADKPIDEILKMRMEQKMGWGKIAKQLNLHPSELGKASSSINKKHHEARMEKHAAKAERRSKKMERKQNRMEKKANRRSGKKYK